MTNIREAEVWVLTFNRPSHLNRLIGQLGQEGFKVNVLSNYPEIKLLKSNEPYLGDLIVNTLNDPESNAWCARSWNSIFLKAFKRNTRLICFQDDTSVAPMFGQWMNQNAQKYNFMWGPGGDQWFYLTLDVLKAAGWWDERYIGCYCADADWLKRVWMWYGCQEGNNERISIEEFHTWGFVHNRSGIQNTINTTYEAKVTDLGPGYVNQHWDFEKRGLTTITASQQHFRQKWGYDLDTKPLTAYSMQPALPEIDWYPWATQKFGINPHNL